jgi:hypothetical protein
MPKKIRRSNNHLRKTNRKGRNTFKRLNKTKRIRLKKFGGSMDTPHSPARWTLDRLTPEQKKNNMRKDIRDILLYKLGFYWALPIDDYDIEENPLPVRDAYITIGVPATSIYQADMELTKNLSKLHFKADYWKHLPWQDQTIAEEKNKLIDELEHRQTDSGRWVVWLKGKWGVQTRYEGLDHTKGRYHNNWNGNGLWRSSTGTYYLKRITGRNIIVIYDLYPGTNTTKGINFLILYADESILLEQHHETRKPSVTGEFSNEELVWSDGDRWHRISTDRPS